MTTEIILGAVADSLERQLLDLVSQKAASIFERDSKSISRLHIRGMLTDSECDRARKRLMNKIAKEMTIYTATLEKGQP